MNTNMHPNFERDVWNSVLVVAYIILKGINEEKCQVKMLPWQQFLPEFSESDVGPLMKELWKYDTNLASFFHVLLKNNHRQVCLKAMATILAIFHETTYHKIFHWYKHVV